MAQTTFVNMFVLIVLALYWTFIEEYEFVSIRVVGFAATKSVGGACFTLYDPIFLKFKEYDGYQNLDC